MYKSEQEEMKEDKVYYVEGDYDEEAETAEAEEYVISRNQWKGKPRDAE
jgi:hypothetical protein